MKFSASHSDALNLHELQHLAPEELKLLFLSRCWRACWSAEEGVTEDTTHHLQMYNVTIKDYTL